MKFAKNQGGGSLLPVVFGLSEPEAAASFSISTSKFRELVKNGRAPKPRRIDGRAVWDVDELKAAFKDFPHVDENEKSDLWSDVASSA